MFYILCGIGAAIVQMGAMAYDLSKLERQYLGGEISPETFYGTMNIPTLGASGAVMGIFAAFAYTFPNSQLLILPIPFPIKAKWALLGLVLIDLFGGISNQKAALRILPTLVVRLLAFCLLCFGTKKIEKPFINLNSETRAKILNLQSDRSVIYGVS